MNRLTYNNVRTLERDWTTAGLDDDVRQAIAHAFARDAALVHQLEEFAHTAETSREEGHRLVAAGTLTLLDAVTQQVAGTHRDVANTLIRRARERVMFDLTQTIGALGNTVIDQLAAREAELYEQAAKPIGTLDGITDPEAAFKAGSKATGAWHELDGIAAIIKALDSVYFQLDLCEMFTVLWDYPRPKLLPHVRPTDHAVATLAAVVTSGAGPREPMQPAPRGKPRPVVGPFGDLLPVA